MKRFDFLLSGYYGMSNFGDDALLLASASGVEHHLGTGSFCVTARTTNLPGASCALPERQRFRGHDRLSLYQHAAASRSIVFGGGSTLHSERDLNLKRHMLKLAGKGPHLALGIGVGPFPSVGAEHACARLLQQLAFVGARDQASLERVRRLAPSTPSELTFDLALSLPDMLRDNAAEERAGIGVALCPLESVLGGSGEAEQRRIAKLAAVLGSVAEITGEPLVAVDFNGHRRLGDRALHRRLQSMLPTGVACRHVSYAPEPARYAEVLGSLRLLLTMRLHGAVFGYMCRTPLVFLEYHEKCGGFSKEIGLTDTQRVDCRSLEPPRLLSNLLYGLRHGFDQGTLPLELARHRALANWRGARAAI